MSSAHANLSLRAAGPREVVPADLILARRAPLMEPFCRVARADDLALSSLENFDDGPAARHHASWTLNRHEALACCSSAFQSGHTTHPPV